MRKPVILIVSVLSIAGLGIAKTSGSPGGYSSAPGESKCTSCHGGFAINSGPNSLGIAAPATTVGLASLPIDVAFAASGSFKFGFEVSARDHAGAKVAAWQITDPTRTQSVSGNVTHTSTGALSSTWSMAFNPPAGLPAGPLTFYACGLEGNGGGSSGDHVYTGQTTVYQAQISTPVTTWPLGTTQTLSLAAPTRPGDEYVVAMSDNTTPTPLPGGLSIPVDLSSSLFKVGITTPAFFQNFVGALDGAGSAQAQVFVPPLALLSGFQLHFAFAAVTPGMPVATEVSNRVSVVLQ